MNAARSALWLVLLAAAGTFALTMGVRQTMGLFLSPLNTSTGLGLGAISLAFGFGQLWWGLTQPVAGLVADRIGAGRVLIIGVLMVALGTAITPYMTTTWGLIVAVGILSAGGAGMAGPAVLMAATTRLLEPRHRGMATGIVNAGGSTGQFLMAPLAAALIASAGWVMSMQTLALLVLLALPAAWVLKGSSRQSQDAQANTAPALTSRQAVNKAFSDRSYVLLALGFFVCGFHVAFLATHLPGVVAWCGLSVQTGAWAIAVLGLFNIVGSLAMGWAVGRWRMKHLLAWVYLARALAILAFLAAPKTEFVMLTFAAIMGLTFLSTVPPTAGLVAKLHGTSHLATLFGLVMVTHQVGGFLGATLGGVLFEATGSYQWMWWADVLLAFAACLLHLPIRETALPARSAVA